MKNNDQISYKLVLKKEFSKCNDGLLSGQRHIYITSDEEIKDNTWVLNIVNGVIYKTYSGINFNLDTEKERWRKIILTTDQDLIKDGVQEIDDEFLKWFVKNPNCEEIEVVDVRSLGVYGSYYPYKIIIPKEEPKQDRTCTNNCSVVCGECQILEPKQETLEEAVKREYDARKFNSDYPFNPQSFILGAKWQQEQDKNLYSEEDLLKFGAFVRIEDRKEKRLFLIQDYFKKWKQFKKK